MGKKKKYFDQALVIRGKIWSYLYDLLNSPYFKIASHTSDVILF